MSKELEGALALVSAVCARINGTLADHQAIQGALEIIRKALAAGKDTPNDNQ